MPWNESKGSPLPRNVAISRGSWRGGTDMIGRHPKHVPWTNFVSHRGLNRQEVSPLISNLVPRSNRIRFKVFPRFPGEVLKLFEQRTLGRSAIMSD